MALILPQTKCAICGQRLQEEDLVSFPAFLPQTHRLARFSDAAFHRACIEQDKDWTAVQLAFSAYEKMRAELPRSGSYSDAEEGGRKRYAEFLLKIRDL